MSAASQPADGIYAAVHVALNAGEDIDWDLQRAYVRQLLGRSLQGFFVCGTTGEFPFLSLEERERLMELTAEEARGKAAVIAHVGGVATRDCVRLARHAERCGAVAVSAVPPFYYAYRRQAILEHLRAVAASVSVPLMYYHIPQRTGVDLDDGLFAELLSIPGLRSIKYSHDDLALQERLQRQAGADFKFYCGCDELLAASLLTGAAGAIGSTYNFLAPVFVPLWHAARSGRWSEARALQAQANRVIAVLAAYPSIAASKEALRLAGVATGEPRRPQARLAADERARFESEILAAGLLDRSRVR